MASGGAGSGQVVLRGRFKPGSRVQLVEVAGEHVLRAQGGREVAEGVVGDDGCVAFSSGVKVGGRYFVVGRVDGFPLEVRCRGNRAGEESTALAQEPVRSDRTRLANGAWSDEAPEAEAAPGAQVAPGPAQHQVPVGSGAAVGDGVGCGYADGSGARRCRTRGRRTCRRAWSRRRVRRRGSRRRWCRPGGRRIPTGSLQRSDTPMG
jgi:hypothetical protein